MRLLRTWVALVASGTTAGAVHAETLGVLAVAPGAGPSAELVEITIQLRQVISGYHPGMLDAQQLRMRMTGVSPGASLTELDRAYEAARLAYVSGDHAGSVRSLRAIIADLEKLPDGPETFHQWTRAMMRLARCELDLGHEDSGREIIERLVLAAPDVQADRNLYPARFAQHLERARAALNAVPRHALHVSSAEGARVYVNGRDVGTAPATVELPAGRYRVSGAQGALTVPPIAVEMDDRDQEVAIDFAIPGALRPALGPGLALPDDDLPGRIIAAGGYLGLDAVIAVRLVEEDGILHVVGSSYDVRRGTVEREARVRLRDRTIPVGGTSALAEFLVTGKSASELIEIPGLPRPAARDLSAPRPHVAAVDLRPQEISTAAVPGRPLAWTALGTGIAFLGLAAFGIIEQRAANGNYDRASALRASGDLVSRADILAYNEAVASGDAAKRNATVALVGAGVAALATGIVGYIHYRRTGEVGPFRF